MTTQTTTSPPVAAELTDLERTGKLVQLARYGDEHMLGVVRSRLARLAHPLLSGPRRLELFETYCEAIEAASALRQGVAYWTQFFGSNDFRGFFGDPQDSAAEVMEDRANQALHVLVHGEVER